MIFSAYLDDSGTDDELGRLVYGGIIGSEEQLASFEEAWRGALANPADGRGPISEFHMVDCHGRNREFHGWSKVQAEQCIQRFHHVILNNEVMAFGNIVDGDAFDEFVRNRFPNSPRDAEELCMLSALDMPRKLVGSIPGQHSIAFVIDNRPHREAINREIFRLIQEQSHVTGAEYISIKFMNSAEVCALQAADLVAWELRRSSRPLLTGVGLDEIRPELVRLISSGKIAITRFNQDAIYRLRMVLMMPNVLTIDEIKKRAETDPSIWGRLGVKRSDPPPAPESKYQARRRRRREKTSK